jgi:hypothetical protein
MGIKNALRELMNTTQAGPNEGCIYSPVEIHLTVDSSCSARTMMGNTSGLNTICDYLQDWIDRGAIMLGFSNCLDPAYPDACINPATYLEPESIGINAIIIHEYNHLLLTCLMVGNVQEQFCYSVEYTLSDNHGVKTIYSFCDLNSAIGMGYDDYRFPYDLCASYSFDIGDIPDLYYLLNREYSSKIGTPGQYAPNRPIGNRYLKCAVDSIVGQNVYSLFVQDICNNGTHPALCNFTNPASNNYIDPSYCGN